MKLLTVYQYIQSHQKVPSSMYAHLVPCMEGSRAFPFFVNFTESPKTSDATDELASIVYKPSARIAERAIRLNQMGHIDTENQFTSCFAHRNGIYNLSKPLFLKYGSTSNGNIRVTGTKRTSLHDD